MHPTLIQIGPLAIRGYGLMLAIGFFTGILLTAHRAKKDGQNPDHIYNLSIWIVVSSLLGARVYYVITHYDEFRALGYSSTFTRIFMELKNIFWPIGADGQIGINGLVLYGGLIAATVTTAVYLSRHRLSIPRFMDYIAPGLGLGEFFTRIGCFLNGCCFGKPTESVFGMVFPPDSAAGMYYPDLHIHPAQLYNSFAGLIIFVALVYLERFKRSQGFTSLLYFALYSAGRFIIDYTRYYESELVFGGLSHNQLISLCVFIASAVVFIYAMKKSKRGKTPGK